MLYHFTTAMICAGGLEIKTEGDGACRNRSKTEGEWKVVNSAAAAAAAAIAITATSIGNLSTFDTQ